MKRLLSVALVALFLCGSLAIVGCETKTAEDEAKSQKREVQAGKRKAPGPGGGGVAADEEGGE